MPDSTLAVATSCHWVKKIISYSNFHQTFQIGSHFFGNTYGLVKKIFRAKKRTSIGLIFSHFRPIFLIFGLFFSPTENFVILFPLLLIFLIVLFVALLPISKSIYKMHKLPKMTQVLWLLEKKQRKAKQPQISQLGWIWERNKLT